MRLDPNLRFGAGLALSVAFVFFPWLSLKVAVLAVFVVLGLWHKPRLRLWPFLLTTLTILAFNIFPPQGRELWMIGGFPVTDGALRLGIDRAVTFEGLLLISKVAVRQGLTLPGSLGRTVSATFRTFGLIAARRTRFSLRDSVASIDALMEELEGAADETAEPPTG